MSNHLKPDNCICKNCGKSFKTNSAYLKRGGGKYCCVPCMREYKVKNASVWIDSLGYLVKRHKRVHRTIMEEVLGRKLGRKEHIHHLDGNRLNNDISNLVLLSDSEHHKLHPSPRATGYFKKCIICGKQIYTTPSDDVQFCSLPCYWKAKKGTWGKTLKRCDNLSDY